MRVGSAGEQEWREPERAGSAYAPSPPGRAVVGRSGGGLRAQLGVYGTRCLDVNGAATGNGTTVILWSCTAAANQRWTLR
ncbi:RICIN domain-containing protein [Micromonospora halotolerans]|uniref:RICIN domain-containing protein n=1 Tax=Micromonospora halotolerans TaxID=709879 RepID=A0ABY9ZRU0_9ACTN|nr:RICIN domain-containing protein [Micromonospora halotolerans]WNM38014.1 RICIN domain-containing protein [Micromonospora halotolerans]